MDDDAVTPPDFGSRMNHEWTDCEICARQISRHRDAPGGRLARPIPTTRSLLQAERERVMANGEGRLAALLRRHA